MVWTTLGSRTATDRITPFQLAMTAHTVLQLSIKMVKLIVFLPLV